MDTNKKEIYLVEGMTCSGCENTVQRVVTNLKGVSSAKADLKTASVSVEYDPKQVDIDQIRSAINKVGYKFVGELPAHGQKPGSDQAIA